VDDEDSGEDNESVAESNTSSDFNNLLLGFQSENSSEMDLNSNSNKRADKRKNKRGGIQENMHSIKEENSSKDFSSHQR